MCIPVDISTTGIGHETTHTMNEQIIQTLLQEFPSQILAGVSPEDTDAIAAGFEHLLKLVLDVDDLNLPNLDVAALDAATWDVGRDLIKETSEVPPRNGSSIFN